MSRGCRRLVLFLAFVGCGEAGLSAEPGGPGGSGGKPDLRGGDGGAQAGGADGSGSKAGGRTGMGGGAGAGAGAGGGAGDRGGASPAVDGSVDSDASASDAQLPQDGQGPPDGGAAACPPPAAVAPASLEPSLTEVVFRLTGETEIAPGLRLSDRASAQNRARARSYLSTELQRAGLSPEEHDYGSGINLFARLDPTRGEAPYVVLGAHYDTVPGSPGTSDNASGTAAILAIATRLAALPCRARGFLVVFFDEEEKGLIGSYFFAQKLLDEGISVHSVHSIDQVAWDENQDGLVELERPDGDLQALYQAARMRLRIGLSLAVTRTGATDHVSFRPEFPAIGISEGYSRGDTSPHRHRPTDTADTADYGYLSRVTALVYAVMAKLLEG